VTFERVTVDPAQMGGQPSIRGLRVPVATIVAMVADAMTTPEILSALPDLETDEVAEALRYAAEKVPGSPSRGLAVGVERSDPSGSSA
jgi:uncharacterized protein (DUF433 family)